MNIESDIYKIRFNQMLSNYRLIFKNIDKAEFCEIAINSSDAKNIALSKENIKSSRLKTYDLLLNIISSINLKINKVIISKRNNNILSTIYLTFNNSEITLDSNIIDSIILSLKNYSPIYINSSFYSSNNKIVYNYSNKNIINNSHNKISNNDKIKRLKNMLDDLITTENYEFAAVIRDRISKISDNKED